MVKLLILADDFTGAFDTGIQFASRGAATTVVTKPEYDFALVEQSAEVLVMVTETRHLPPQEAYKVVYRTARRALQTGIAYIYAKTDSALRGNVGSELAALMEAAGISSIPFLPALPKLNRVTRAGVHYIDGVPVAQSVFGQDPFEPVLDSAVADILGRQTAVPAVVHPKSAQNAIIQPGIQIFDAETDQDLRRIGEGLGLEQLRFCAGCSGFAAVLADLLHLEGEIPRLPNLEETLFVACGSVNPVSVRQMKVAEERGFPRVHLTPAQKLEKTWVSSALAGEYVRQWVAQATAQKRFILDVNGPAGHEDTDLYAQSLGLTMEQLRVQVSNNLAALIKQMLDNGLKATLLCTGGDTLLALMQAVGVWELTPICEMATGVVLTKFIYNQKTYHIISKSGGFGSPTLLLELAEALSRKPETL
ncbi:MAG: four-carbon acid sugar kinase family protein [Oscillospiraceae bacterium]